MVAIFNDSDSWAPAGMGKGGLVPPGNVVVFFFVLQMLSKVSVEEVMHYLKKMSAWTLLGDFRPSDPLSPSLSTPGKILQAPM